MYGLSHLLTEKIPEAGGDTRMISGFGGIMRIRRIRHDAAFISSVLFTIALVALAPHNLNYASTWRRATIQETDRLFIGNYFAPIGFAGLAFVFVGLIVVWAGYVQRVRWTWFVMFVLVCVYVFPLYVLSLSPPIRS